MSSNLIVQIFCNIVKNSQNQPEMWKEQIPWKKQYLNITNKLRLHHSLCGHIAQCCQCSLFCIFVYSGPFSLHIFLFSSVILWCFFFIYSYSLLSHLAAFSFLKTLYILEDMLHNDTHMHTNTHAHTQLWQILLDICYDWADWAICYRRQC